MRRTGGCREDNWVGGIGGCGGLGHDRTAGGLGERLEDAEVWSMIERQEGGEGGWGKAPTSIRSFA